MVATRAQSPVCEYPVLSRRELISLVKENDIDLDEDELDQVTSVCPFLAIIFYKIKNVLYLNFKYSTFLAHLSTKCYI